MGDEIVGDDDLYWREEDLKLQLMGLGRRVDAVRALKDLTQEQVAKRAGLTRSTVGKIEDGTANPRLTTLLKVAAALEVPPAELLKGVSGDGNSL